MSFSTWAGTFVDGVTTITADFLNNYVKPLMAYAVDGRGGSYTTTSKIQIGGTGGLELTETAGSASRVQLASRSVTRMMDGKGYVVPSGAGWAYDSVAPTTGAFKYINTSPGVECLLPIAVPDGAVIREVKVYFQGGSGHAAFPGGAPTMPIVNLLHYDITTGALTSLGTQSDTTTTAIAYESTTPHAITLTGLNHTVRRDVRRYFVEFTAEAGGNFQNGGTIHGVRVKYDMTYYDEHGTG